MLIAYVLALSSTNHMMGVLAAPAVAVYVLLDRLARHAAQAVGLGMGLALALAVSGKWGVVIDGPMEERVAVLALVGAVLGYTAWRDPGEFRRPMLYLSVLAVAVGMSLNYFFLPIRAAPSSRPSTKASRSASSAGH